MFRNICAESVWKQRHNSNLLPSSFFAFLFMTWCIFMFPAKLTDVTSQTNEGQMYRHIELKLVVTSCTFANPNNNIKRTGSSPGDLFYCLKVVFCDFRANQLGILGPKWCGSTEIKEKVEHLESPLADRALTPRAHQPWVQVHTGGTIVHVWQACFAICVPQGFWLRRARTLEHMYTFARRIITRAAAVWACVNGASSNQRQHRRSKSHFHESPWAEQSLEKKFTSLSPRLRHTHTHTHTRKQAYVLLYSEMHKISLLANELQWPELRCWVIYILWLISWKQYKKHETKLSETQARTLGAAGAAQRPATTFEAFVRNQWERCSHAGLLIMSLAE